VGKGRRAADNSDAGAAPAAEKSNEIPCVRKLLRVFRNVRLLVTIDAMHIQAATARLIRATLGPHYPSA
jgi:predicted transposase YbfD/YdcC